MSKQSYRLISADRGYELEIAVNHLLKEGWTAQGGVVVRPALNGRSMLYQTLVKEYPSGRS